MDSLHVDRVTNQSIRRQRVFERRLVSAAARLTFLALLVALTTSFGADAQPAGKVARIGFLSGDAPPSGSLYYPALSDLGWREGSNLSTEWRWPDGRLERLPDLAAELVRLNVDVIVAGAFTPGQEARIVHWIQVEPVESHLAHPANVGGSCYG